MAQPQRRARVTKAQIVERAVRQTDFPVRWSRPGLERVRLGKGYVIDVHPDGSLKIADELNGGIRTIKPEFVDRHERVETKRSIRWRWRKWTAEDTAAVIAKRDEDESSKVQ